MKLSLVVLAMVVALVGNARAQQPPTEAPPPAPVDDPQKVSISWSPVHLVLPVVEIEGEFSPAPHIGVGVILGAGRVSNADDTVTATAIEGGAQFNYYFMHKFSGLHAGAEVVYLHAGDVEQDATLSGAGISAGPYAGYKVLTSFGFTFVAQLGVQVVYISAENTVDMKSETKFSPLLNLNVGWSF
jgi:hypothetical protein